MYLKFNLYIPPLYVRCNRNILTNRNFRHIPSPYPLDEQIKFLIKILNILNKAQSTSFAQLKIHTLTSQKSDRKQ